MARTERDRADGARLSDYSDTSSLQSGETMRAAQSQRQDHDGATSNKNNRVPSLSAGPVNMSRSHSLGQRTRPPAPDLYTSMFSWSPTELSSADQRKHSGYSRHRKALAVLEGDDIAPHQVVGPNSRIVSILPDGHQQEQNPLFSPYSKISSTDGRGTFFSDQSEHESSPASPTFRPGTGRSFVSELADIGYNGDHRRPSAASATTVSSQGSRSSTGGRFRKRLQGFFGDEYTGPRDHSKQDPDNGTYAAVQPPRQGLIDHFKARERANSDGSQNISEKSFDLPQSQHPSRPHSPLPPSDIAPWIYQNADDIPQLGEAPIRQTPIEPGIYRTTSHGAFQPASASTSQRDLNRRVFNGHRHSRSKDEKSTVAGDLAGYSSRPTTGRDDLPIGLRPLKDTLSYPTAMSSATTLGGRSTSPTSSIQSGLSRELSQSSPGPTANKRSLLDKIRRPKGHGPLKHFPGSSKAVQDPQKTSSKRNRREDSPSRRARHKSLEAGTPKTVHGSDHDRKKDGKGIMGPTKFLRHAAHDDNQLKYESRVEELNTWELDTDIDGMSGIIAMPSSFAPSDGINSRNKFLAHYDGSGLPIGSWNAPESWQVKKPSDDISARLPKIADEIARSGPDKSDGHTYFIRVFRIDKTFATLSAPLNATVDSILVMLGRKSFLQDHLNNYEIVMRRHDLSRTLQSSEQPVLIQKRLLEQVGYTAKDKIEDIGREDHSYLCRFIFLPTKLSGYTSLEGDPGFSKLQKFSHIDLQGRNLVTIPITLYKRSSEILSLNLSRNLSLDVPQDFIQGCINLREIKFVSNDCLRLPASFSLASRLALLDISNNRLEELEHAGLDKLHGLVSIKMANNKLSSLPSYFGEFRHLRSLNMSSNNFQVFPEFLCKLKSLVDLDISFNAIEEVPHIGSLTALERLWMANNLLSGPLDTTFSSLVSLKQIDARFNAITNIDSLSLLPCLEQLLLGHNAVSKFRGSFPKLRTLVIDHCPITQFDLDVPVPTLATLNVASAKLVQLRDSLFENMANLTKLVLDKNHFISISPHIGKLRKLEYFSMIKNPLASLPATIGCLSELKYLNLRECNLNKLPPEIWYCANLETLNLSSNVLDSFPRPGVPPIQVYNEPSGPLEQPGSAGYSDLDNIEEPGTRRPSQASGGGIGTGSPPSGGRHRKPSFASSLSQGGRKISTTSSSRFAADASGAPRKDSNYTQHIATTFAGSLRHLYLADNRLEDDVFRELSMIPELRIVNLSYNGLSELPQGLLKRWPFLTELYLSGNELTSLPSDDLEEGSNLRVLHINANRFLVLPAELCKVSKLAILDVGSNALKYNVSNWPYDWNWNWNRNLKYLNFSGNKRLEVKPSNASLGPAAANGADLTDFNSLTHLRVLGLMDVTLTTSTIPEENEDRRVRTSASLAASVAYGMADSLGRNEHLSIIDMIVPRLNPDNVDTLMGMFDGQTLSSGGSRVSKYLHENFIPIFSAELKKLQQDQEETPEDALRRTFLTLNKKMAAAAYKSVDERDVHQYRRGPLASRLISQDDINSGGAATVIYLHNMDLYAANVGDVQAILVKSDGRLKYLTQNHDPAEASERVRIRAAGGFVSRNGKLNEVLSVSRSFGYFPLIPSVIAAPYTMHVGLTEQDEMIVIASRELWDYVTPDTVVDVTRAERGDLMIAAQRLRDLAISFGANDKLMVMILGVSSLKKRERYKVKSSSLSIGPSAFPEDQIIPSTKRAKKPRDFPGDSRLARFDFVDAPVGELAIIFTDIKMSTSLWETCPDAMRSAIQIHNDILRRQLGIVGGYEVKTEGDAFMVAFATTTAALLWCFNCQTQLLEAEWPTEILEQPQCSVQYDMEDNIIFRGLSVRMGVHWGEPVSEKDPVTNRMDYFGPMVNRASRISAVADGGEIFVSSDFMGDMLRNQELFADSGRTSSTESEDAYPQENLNHNIRRELQQLNSQGYVVKDQGVRKLKGLENPESLYLVFPQSLSGRMTALEERAAKEKRPTTISRHSQLEIQTDLIWRLWDITLRLEMICGSLEHPGVATLKEPNTALFNIIRNHGGELADSTVLGLIELLVTRVEVTANTLAFRHLMRPFKPGDRLIDHASPMGEVIQQLQTQLAEYRALKELLANSADGTAAEPRGLLRSEVQVDTRRGNPSPSLLWSRPNSPSMLDVRQ